MFQNNISSITQNVQSSQRRTSSQFLKKIMHEELRTQKLRAQEIQMTSENPIRKEEILKTQICNELKELKQQEFIEEKRKILLHQNVDEIRELDVQIKRAHIQKQLSEQKALKELKIKEDLKARLEENKRFEEECQRKREIDLREEEELRKKKAAFRQDLLNQMHERDRKRSMEREFIKKERENMQKFLKNIEQDTENERRRNLEIKELLRQDREEYLEKVKLHKSQQKLDTQEDNKNYMKMIKEREEAKKLRHEKRRQNIQKRADFSERIGQQVYELHMEEEKHNKFLLELLIEERLAKDDERYKTKFEKQLETARCLREDFQRSNWAREQEKLLKSEEEKNWIKEQVKNFQELEQKDQDLKNFHLTKSRQYCEDLLNEIEDKRREKEIEASRNKIEHEKQLALQESRRQEIEEEKLRLLRLVPLEILKFLPAKAISNKHRSLLGLTCKETKDNV